MRSISMQDGGDRRAKEIKKIPLRHDGCWTSINEMKHDVTTIRKKIFVEIFSFSLLSHFPSHFLEITGDRNNLSVH